MIHFFVPGIPKPKNQDWKEDVKQFAVEAHGGQLFLEGPIKLSLTFYVIRPKNHFRNNSRKKGLKLDAPPFPVIRPDCLKLARCVEDALTGIIWKDDSQIYYELIVKRYSDWPGVDIYVREEKAT